MVSWSIDWASYNPTVYTSPSVDKKPWADSDISLAFQLNFNGIDGKVNRTSFTGKYQVDIDGYPLNPMGRTGMKGRGLLGRWGPNQAADPILTRWTRDDFGNIIHNKDSKRPILQFLAIERAHEREWAIPGGYIDSGEDAIQAATREFLEETMDSDHLNVKELDNLEKVVGKVLSKGEIIYQGYVDDPRNTDNAWMETTAINFHADGSQVDGWKFRAGSDAKSVTWIEVSSNLQLFASHAHFIHLVALRHRAHW